jgi:hypothetical protein
MPVPYAGSMRVRVLVAARRNQPTEHIMKRHITLGLAMLAGQSKSSAAYAMVDIGEMTDPNLIWEQLLPKVTPAPAGGTYGGVGNRVAAGLGGCWSRRRLGRGVRLQAGPEPKGRRAGPGPRATGSAATAGPRNKHREDPAGPSLRAPRANADAARW